GVLTHLVLEDGVRLQPAVWRDRPQPHVIIRAVLEIVVPALILIFHMDIYPPVPGVGNGSGGGANGAGGVEVEAVAGLPARLMALAAGVGEHRIEDGAVVVGEADAGAVLQ